jgi:hypothetical protein
MTEIAVDGLKTRGADRRTQTWRALWVGCFNPRRRTVRRASDHRLAAIDWHHPQWLAVAMLILLMCCVDMLLTLILVGAGGSEVNPVMRPLVTGTVSHFIFWKFGLTALGVVFLVLTAGARLFGRVGVAPILYLLMCCYMALVLWELWLLSTGMGITSVAMLLEL